VNVATLALNPSLDVSYTIPSLIANQKAHASKFRYDPGGNSINVAKGLQTLGIEVHVFAIIPGDIGNFVKQLLANHLDHWHAITVAGETRVNMTILTDKPSLQYEVDGIGPVIGPRPLKELTEEFVSHCRNGVGVLSGSIPPGVHRNIYAHLSKQLTDNSARAVVDAQSSLLQASLSAGPYLIKPNKYELETLFGITLPTLQDVVREAGILHKEGVANVCVSIDREGAVLVADGGTYYARPPEVPVISTVGSGDSMVAGLLAGLMKGASAGEALRLGVACGTATATKPGTQMFSYADVEKLLPAITVERIEG